MLQREYKPEIMDDFSIRDERINSALSELKIINKYLGGNKISEIGIKKLLKGRSGKNNIKILDAGTGGADNLIRIKNEKAGIEIFGIDLNKQTCKILKDSYPSINIVYGNMMLPPFAIESFDIVHFSLILHHFSETAIKKIIQDYMAVSKIGIVINDLHRSYTAYLGIKILTALFSKSNMVKNDAPLSVRRGFKKNEIIKIIEDAGTFKYIIKWHWAFRWMVVIFK